MSARLGRTPRPSMVVAGFLLAAALTVVGFVTIAHSRSGAPAGPVSSIMGSARIASAGPEISPAVSPPGVARKPDARRTAARKAVRLPVKPLPVVPAGPSIDAYKGLASWVDIYDERAWNDPASAVKDMAGHGVKTLFIETANSNSGPALNQPGALQTFIHEAHARHMRIVAWYLPDMQSVSTDYDRIAQAIRFTTADGQKFDSFALDIESDSLQPISARNAALGELSGKIRGLVGPTYPLGAIIPSPVALSTKPAYWGGFPYTMLAQTYNVFVPMSYYTYHGNGLVAAYSDTSSNVKVIRAQNGCSKIPIHLIGGIAENSSPEEVRAFMGAARDTGCIGAGLYGWAGTSPGGWQELMAVKL